MKETKVVIIGSGLGGLACGIILARKGHDVTILEQGTALGGCLQGFRRGGVQFNTGMHYIGRARPGDTLHQLLDLLGIAGKLPLSPLNKRGYDLVALCGEKYAFAAGREAFIETMLEKFPHEKESLGKYADLIERTAEAASLRGTNNAEQMRSLMEMNSISIEEMLRRVTGNERLQQVLAGRIPLIAATRERTPFLLYALITDFYANGGYRIVGGGKTLQTLLVRQFKSLGGKVLKKQKVMEITTDDGGVTGVSTQCGEKFEADIVISDAPPAETLRMVDSPLIRPAFRQRISSLPQTTSCFTLYLKFKQGAMPYFPFNYFSYRQNTPWDCEKYTDADWPRGYLFMQEADSISPRYATAAEVISYMRWEEVEKFAYIGRKPEQNPALEYILAADENKEKSFDYFIFKGYCQERLLRALEKDFPGIRSKIAEVYTSTPLTYRDYTSTPQGSMYGVAADFSTGSAGRVPIRWRVPGLFQTGQCVNSHGLQGTLIGALQTCEMVESYEGVK